MDVVLWRLQENNAQKVNIISLAAGHINSACLDSFLMGELFTIILSIHSPLHLQRFSLGLSVSQTLTDSASRVGEALQWSEWESENER